MRRSSISIAKTFTLYAGLPMILVLCIVVGGLTYSKVTDYVEARALLTYDFTVSVSELDEFAGDRVDALELTFREGTAQLNQRFFFDLTFISAILVVGIALPVIASRRIAFMVEQNLNLMAERLRGEGDGDSELTAQGYDFAEFSDVAAAMSQALREYHETEKRWRRAEKELVGLNRDLIEQAQELNLERKIALNMMEDAEVAQRELEAANRRLGMVIEDARASAQEADFANRSKSDFLATMSHEIRTPLNGVIGFVDMLAETDLDEEQLDYVDTVRTSGRTLMALINDVLDFSKIESGQLNLEVRTFDLMTMLDELVGLFYNEANRKKISLELEVGEGVSNYVSGDETRIRQIITNLVANAVKFTEKGGVKLIVSQESVSGRAGVCMLQFEVRDTGIGMSLEQLRGIFRPFAQGDASTTRKYGGTGLGLVICKRLAEAMRGKVWAISQAGQGSSFLTRIQLSIGEEVCDTTPKHIPRKSHEGEEDPQKPGDKLPLRIAVAEDNHANQRVLMIMLRRLGWESAFLENGEELLEYLKVNPCDLVFMDLQMPVMDGLEATDLVRSGAAGERARGVKIIALTANALSSDEARCLKAGMDAYLSKPIKIDLLERKIVKLFASDEPEARAG